MVDNPAFPPLGGGVTRPPDTGTTAGIPLSYADKLKTNIKWDNRFKRNVLEIILDNDNKKFVNIPDNVIDRLFKTLGKYIKSQVEGFFRKNTSSRLGWQMELIWKGFAGRNLSRSLKVSGQSLSVRLE